MKKLLLGLGQAILKKIKCLKTLVNNNQSEVLIIITIIITIINISLDELVNRRTLKKNE